MDKDKQSFVLYRSWAAYLLALPDQQAAQLIKAICAAETGADYTIDDPMLGIYFSSVVLPELQKNDERYERKRQNAIESARKRTQAIESERKRTQASESVHVSVSESVSDSVSVSESVSASEKEKKGAAHSAYDSDPELNSAIKDFVDQRKKMRKPMTDRAIQLFCNRLESLSKGDKALKIQMIDTAIERGWQTVYPPKEEKHSGGSAYVDAIRNRYDGIDEWAQGGETYDESGV